MTITTEEIAQLRKLAAHLSTFGDWSSANMKLAAQKALPRLLDEIERLRAEAANWHNLRPVYAAAEREAAELRADLREALALLRKGYLLVCAHKAAFQSYAECNDTFCASGFDHEPREDMDKFVDDSDALLAKHKGDA